MCRLMLAGGKGRERRRERKWGWRAANTNTEIPSAFLSLFYHKKTFSAKAMLRQGTAFYRPSPKHKQI